MSAGRLRTAVADTSALVSLAVPRADTAYGTDTGPDPLQYLLTSCEVFIPRAVRRELRDLTRYDDIHAVAADNVLAADSHYTVEDPYGYDDVPEARPDLGLDAGETDGIVLANELGVDGFLTDEFGGTNFALIHAGLHGPRIIPAPRLIFEYARNGYVTSEEAKALLDTIGEHRSWEHSAYVAQLRRTLDQ